MQSVISFAALGFIILLREKKTTTKAEHKEALQVTPSWKCS